MLDLSLDDEYDANVPYPDAEFTSLVARTASAADLQQDEVLRKFGRFAATSEFLRLYPQYYASATGTRDFLLGVEEQIHEIVRGAIPGAYPPRLRVLPLGEEGVAVTYTSERGLCQLLEGLVEGIAEHYRERMTLSHGECMRRGALACAVFVEPAADAH